MAWQMDEMGVQNAVDVGGDNQVGEAYEARFVNPDLPRRVVRIMVFVSAPELDMVPVCPHSEPEGWKCVYGREDLHPGNGYVRCVCYLPPEHTWCSHDLDSLGIETYTEYVIARERVSRDETIWDYPEWEERDPYDFLDTAPFDGDVKKAGRVARQWLVNFDPDHITWNGEPF